MRPAAVLALWLGIWPSVLSAQAPCDACGRVHYNDDCAETACARCPSPCPGPALAPQAQPQPLGAYAAPPPTAPAAGALPRRARSAAAGPAGSGGR